MKFYPAINDEVFKMIFTKENNRDLLEQLIYEATNIKSKVLSVSIPELPKTKLKIKGRTLDVVVKTSDNKIIIIEMNSYYSKNIARKNYGYMCMEYAECIKKGEKYEDMPTVIQINFIVSKDTNMPYYDYFTPYYHISKRNVVDNFIGYNFVLSKKEDKCYNLDRKLEIIPLLNKDNNELKKITKSKLGGKFVEEVKRINSDDEFIRFMTAEEDAEKYQKTVESEIRQEGIKQGIKQDKLEIAKKMLENNMDIDIIIKITELSKEEIEKIK